MAKKKTTIDDLAVMVKHGFDGVDKRFEQVDVRFEQVDVRFEQVDVRFDQIVDTMIDKATFGKFAENVDRRFGHLEARMSTMERDVSEIRKHFIYRDEFEDALARLRLVEKKLGIKSGK
ncbi:MAG: hypothetical protein AAB795_03690 [Patescibacteria group bacterium]